MNASLTNKLTDIKAASYTSIFLKEKLFNKQLYVFGK